MSLTLPGTGQAVATDVVGGVHTEYLKLDQGAAGVNDPVTDARGLRVRATPLKSARYTFDKVLATPAVDTAVMTLLKTGTGQSVSQAGGSLVLVGGTTANAESVIRSNATFTGDLVMRVAMQGSNITNSRCYVELVDVIADGVAYTINSTTSITVTYVTNPFTAANVGQGMVLGNFSSVGSSARGVIASVSGLTVTYTMPTMTASTGSGTCSVWGWNYNQICYNGALGGTSLEWDCQRNGWASGVTTLTINSWVTGNVTTTAMNQLGAHVIDQVGGTSTTLETTRRGSRVRNIPDLTALRLQIRVVNGTTAPAGTTYNIGFVDVDQIEASPVILTSIAPVQSNSGLPVEVLAALPTGANTIGSVSLSAAVPAGTNLIGNTGVAAATYTDKSGTITAGGTAQTPIALNAARRGFLIQNNSAGDLWFNTVTTAVQSQPSIKLAAGAYYETPYGGCPTTAVSIIGATTGQAFSAREW